MRRLTLLLLVLLPAFVQAQTPGTCAVGVAQADLATPDLFARLFNTGSLFYGNQTTSGDGYAVPRALGHSSVFAAGLWVGGRVGGEVRTAGSRYEQFEFWPGPLDAGAALPNPADCSAYDRIWVVSPADVAAYEAGGTPRADLAQWPVGLGAPAVDAQGLPVPVGSRAQRLDLPGGERPVFGGGGPTAFWVMNDVGNSHGPDGSAPLGVEVRVTAFVPASGSLPFRQATVYRYTVVNRSAQAIDGFHVGFFTDPDLGDFVDDYVGVDTTRGLAFTYNAETTDAQYGVPPALGFDLLGGLWASSYFVSSAASPTTDPQTPADYYNRLRGLWNDGTPIRERGNGYGPQAGAPVTRYTYAGDPVTGQPWSEVNTGGDPPRNVPGDRRHMLSAPATTLAPGEARTVDLALVFAQGTSYLNSVTVLRAASDRVQAAYDTGTLFAGLLPQGTAAAPALVAPADGASFYESDVTFSWEAVPGADGYVVEVSATADFAEIDLAVAEQTQVTFAAGRFAANRTAPFYWRVRTTQGGLDGPPGPARSFAVYRYVAGPLRLASGAYAYVETTAPGGGPACSGPADPDEGCSEVGGDLIVRSLNSTGDYRAAITQATSTASITQYAPNDFELRFTEQGSIAYAGFTSNPRLFRVPVEVWDVGVVLPGGINDPSDDRQLVIRLTGLSTATPCAFEYERRFPSSPTLNTPAILSYYMATGSYSSFASVAQPLIDADPAGCPTGPAVAAAVSRVNGDPGTSPLESFRLEQASARPVSVLTGTTIRFYTTDRPVTSEGGPAAAGTLALGAAYPNPARGRVTVPVALAGPARLRLIDVLGRTVLEQRLGGGTREARLDVRRLAPGVYAVVLDAAEARAVRMLTVVR